MYCNNAAEYQAAKAASIHPDRFPDEIAWGVWQPPTYPILICPQCMYDFFIEDEILMHLIGHFPYLFKANGVPADIEFPDDGAAITPNVDIPLHLLVDMCCRALIEP